MSLNVEPPQKGFKTFLIIVFIGFSAFFVTRMVKVTVNTVTQANVTSVPYNVKVNNHNPTSASVSWLTEQATTEYILYGTTKDLGFSETTSNKGKTHIITLTGLEPYTTYYYTVGSGSNAYDNEGKPYEFTTSYNTRKANPLKVYGQVIGLDEIPRSNALVYITVKDNSNEGSVGISNTLVTKTDNNGMYSFNLQDLKVFDLTAPFNYDNKIDIAEISVYSEGSERASILVNTSQLQPIPTIELQSKFRLLDLTSETNIKGRQIIKSNKEEKAPLVPNIFEQLQLFLIDLTSSN